MAARRPAENTELVLHTNHVHVCDVQKIRCAQIGRQILLRNLEAHFGRIIVTFREIIHGHDKALQRGNSFATAQRKSVVNVAMPHLRGR